MGDGHLGAHCRPAKLVGNYGFASRMGRGGHVCQPLGVANGFEKQQQNLGRRIGQHHLTQFCDAQIGLVADGCGTRETDAQCTGPADQTTHHRARLGDQRN